MDRLPEVTDAIEKEINGQSSGKIYELDPSEAGIVPIPGVEADNDILTYPSSLRTFQEKEDLKPAIPCTAQEGYLDPILTDLDEADYK